MATKKNGLIQELGPHGEVMKETEYVDGKKHGTQTCYDPDGNPVKITTYENNVRVYEECYYKGQLVSKTGYFNGKKEGICETFDNGIKVCEANYANGKRDGIELKFYKTGIIETRSYYNNGRRGNYETFNPNGTRSISWKDGVDTRYDVNGIIMIEHCYDAAAQWDKEYYITGKLGIYVNNGETHYYDPAGNEITNEEFYAVKLHDYVGFSRTGTRCEITEQEYISRRDAVAAERQAKRQQELITFGVAFTKPLKITPVPTPSSAVVVSAPSSAAVIPSIKRPLHETPTVIAVQSAPKPKKLGFLGRLITRLAG